MFVSYNPAERKAGGGYVLEAGGGVTEGVPPEWEERPHASGQSQYYNIRTKELTWVRPTTTAAAPQSQPTTTASKNTDSLKAALETAHLSQYEDALRQLGVGTAADLVDLEEQDLIEIGMKKIEAKRLMRLAK